MSKQNPFEENSLTNHVKVRVYKPPTSARKSLCGERFVTPKKAPDGVKEIQKGGKYEGHSYADIPFHQAKEKFDTFQNMYIFSDPFILNPKDGSMIPLGHEAGVVMDGPIQTSEPQFACDWPGCGFVGKSQAALDGHKRIHNGQDRKKAEAALQKEQDAAKETEEE